MKYRAWQVNRPDEGRAEALARTLGISRLLARTMVGRGCTDAQQAKALLQSEPMSDPFLLKDMDKAVQRIHRAVESGEPIVIFGDYDVDGITATALLYEYLRNVGAQSVRCRLPSREDEGYGLNKAVLEKLAEKGYHFIITVDNGISAVEETEYAKQLGIELVITDHHLPAECLPDAVAVVDPQREDDESPFKGLSGAGVAFKLCAALEGCSPDEMLDYCGDLAAIGTVADVMPLVGENRTLVREGLVQLQETFRPGLAALAEAAGVADREITAETISFALAPRLNAAGATAIDFAYAIHSAVGNRMIGAKVNNRIVPIDHVISTGEIIEVITGPADKGPSRDWLKIVKTSEAKNKIRNWFKKERREENIAEGRAALDRELRRNMINLTDAKMQEMLAEVARRQRMNSVEEMCAAIGYGGLLLSKIMPKIKEEYTRIREEEAPREAVIPKRVHATDGVIVEGIDNCPIKFAKCCAPLPGDEIVGFITRGFGVSIHKKDCENVKASMANEENRERWVKAYWAPNESKAFRAAVEIEALDRDGLLSDLLQTLGDMRVPILGMNARPANNSHAVITINVSAANTEHMNNILGRLRKVRDVISVTRS